MPPTGHWNDANFLHDLVVVFYEVGMDANVITTEMRKEIASRMKNMRHEVTWEGIRQHIQKLRRTQDSPEKSAKNANVPATPTKATPKRKTRTPKKATPAKSAVITNDSDDEIDFKTEYDTYEEADGRDAKRCKQGHERYGVNDSEGEV